MIYDKLILDEVEAINGYDDAINKLADNKKAVKILTHIRDEEIKHIAELIKLNRGK